MTDLAPGSPRGLRTAQPEVDASPVPDTVRGAEVSATRDRWWSRRWALALGEALVSMVAGVGFMLLCMHISVNPINRIGQVSGLAKVQQYAAVVGLPVLAVLLYTAYRGNLERYK